MCDRGWAPRERISKYRYYLRSMRASTLLFVVLKTISVFAQDDPDRPTVRCDTTTLLDTVRQRLIPIAIHRPADRAMDGLPVILFSHGYNANAPGTYLLYRWLLDSLAADGRVVVSVQHELPGDPPLAMQGDLHAARLPSWERGVANLLHVLGHLRRTCPTLAMNHLAVMGHSQGGDISVRFAMEHPEQLEKLLTLDNRRLALPRTEHPQVYSLRSCDQPADPGVVPTPEEAREHRMTIVSPADIGHNDMGNRGTPAQQAFVLATVRRWMME